MWLSWLAYANILNGRLDGIASDQPAGHGIGNCSIASGIVDPFAEIELFGPLCSEIPNRFVPLSVPVGMESEALVG